VKNEMRKNRNPFLIFLLIISGCNPNDQEIPYVQILESPTQSLLQAISIVDEETIWISGHDATLIRSTDGGKNWGVYQHPTGDTLQFRDIYGFDENIAVVMSAGPGPLSRIFTFTNDSLWTENFVMQDSLGFLDCLDFWDANNGIAYGDAIDEYPYILLTKDGGASWNRAPTNNMPKAGIGEGGFAASGTCVTTANNGQAWIATGAGGNCRVLSTNDYGLTWKEVESPIVSGDAAGNTSISFFGKTGFITGGDLMKANEYTNNCAFSTDGGESWNLTTQPQTKGAFYGGAISQTNDVLFAFACGPNGLDYTSDYGQTWNTLDSLNYWAVSFKNNIGFASGKNGKVLKISL
jgi:photosystem II stability/assembly factor-like uncharacterized protein